MIGAKSNSKMPPTEIRPLFHNAQLSDIRLVFPEAYSKLRPSFWNTVEFPPSGCWIWTGSTGFHPNYRNHVYGHVKVPIPGTDRRRSTSAHRYVWEAMYGPVPKGVDVDHICEVKLCVNPDHLQLLSHWDNCKKVRGGR